MKIAIAATIIIGFALLSSCKEGWTDENKQQYKESCMETAMTTFDDSTKAKAYCDCTMEVVMQKYPSIADYMEHVDSLMVDKDLLKCKTDILNK